jgi:hypothetical protein
VNTIYVFDHSLSPKLSLCLSVLLPEPDDRPFVTPHSVQHLTEEEGVDFKMADAQWISLLAQRDRILVTCLTASKRKLVSAVMQSAGLRAVHLAEGFSHLSIFAQASRLTDWWERVVGKSYRLKPGEGLVVGINGAMGDK